MKILHKITGKLLLEIDTLIGANLKGSNLIGADLRGVDMRYSRLEWADLRGANLEGSNLKGVNLECANLEYANLMGVNLEGANLMGANVATYQSGKWVAYITTTHIVIGCKSFTIDEWLKFSDNDINKMDINALDYWKESREVIFSIHNILVNRGK